MRSPTTRSALSVLIGALAVGCGGGSMKSPMPLAGVASPGKMKRADTITLPAARPSKEVPAATPAERPAIAVDPGEPVSGEGYERYRPNPWVDPAKDKLSTFSIDVDTGSYTLARRKLEEGGLPSPDGVRVEEFLNYFTYDYPAPAGSGPQGAAPFAVNLEAAPSPYDSSRALLKIGVQGRKIPAAERLPVHLTFLVDVSGSMSSSDKLGLVKRALKILVDNLREDDTVALVTYAGSTRVVLGPTGASERKKIMRAIDDLKSGGGTGMASGLELAYQQALANKSEGSVSRVIVCSDGDANLGPSSYEEMLDIIGGYVEQGVTLTTVGVGTGNYQDATMEQLADRGNGNYVYLDSVKAATRFFSEQLSGTLQVIAKDVKIQVEFSDDAVARYRLVGYENRDIADEDFRVDAVDAGEVGAGHAVTAIYELELVGAPKGPLATVRVRAKAPEGEIAKETAYALDAAEIEAGFDAASADFKFAAAVIGFADVLRKNPEAKQISLERVRELARQGAKGMPEREEFLGLVKRAMSILER
jgi:Ca-activated chloride channel homolog